MHLLNRVQLTKTTVICVSAATDTFTLETILTTEDTITSPSDTKYTLLSSTESAVNLSETTGTVTTEHTLNTTILAGQYLFFAKFYNFAFFQKYI